MFQNIMSEFNIVSYVDNQINILPVVKVPLRTCPAKQLHKDSLLIKVD